MTEMSPADVKAVMGHNYGCDGMYNSWIWIILLFALFNGGYGGFGNRYGNGVTQLELQQGFDNQSVMRKLDGITNGLCDGFYAVNTSILNGVNSLGQEVANNRFATQQCCCETNRNIDAVRYENAKNTCEIISASKDNTQKILDYLTQNKIDALRTELQSAQLQLGNLSQTNTLIDRLRPCPIPAYITCSPYQTANAFGCGCGQFV
jgi:hypothetical protein